jgi:ppGpp synthetase/RelA/SpoT-type nucleotidyltranferase
VSATPLSEEERDLVENIVVRYTEMVPTAERLANALFELANDKKLAPYVHSLKKRAKNPAHLRDKLLRKLEFCKERGQVFEVTPDNVFEKVNDLAGVRILHLHTSQFPGINRCLLDLLASEYYRVIEGPIARVWDQEYDAIFKEYGIDTQVNPRMYTSVHYIVSGSNQTRTAEIQVRTLAEELWGEVDHTINYPQMSGVRSCREQIRVLARITSSCTRLVDSIFLTNEDGKDWWAGLDIPTFKVVAGRRSCMFYLIAQQPTTEWRCCCAGSFLHARHILRNRFVQGPRKISACSVGRAALCRCWCSLGRTCELGSSGR